MMEMKITVEAPDLAASILKLAKAIARSDERRVGTEGRSRWSPHH